jgi:hypothetical protein
MYLFRLRPTLMDLSAKRQGESGTVCTLHAVRLCRKNARSCEPHMHHAQPPSRSLLAVAALFAPVFAAETAAAAHAGAPQTAGVTITIK